MSQENRTLQPTLRRRQQARRDGHVPSSRQVAAAAMGLAVAVAATWGGAQMLETSKQLFRQAWTLPWPPTRAAIEVVPAEVMPSLVRLIVPLLGLLWSVAVVSRLAQVGFLWLPDRVVPRADRVDPVRRSQELLSAGQWLEVVTIMSLVVLGVTGISWGIWQQRHQLAELAYVPDFEGALLELASGWLVRLAIGLGVLAAIDFALKRMRFEQQLRMSPEELRAEIRAVEGNPEVARARRGRWNRTTVHDSEESVS